MLIYQVAKKFRPSIGRKDKGSSQVTFAAFQFRSFALKTLWQDLKARNEKIWLDEGGCNFADFDGREIINIESTK